VGNERPLADDVPRTGGGDVSHPSRWAGLDGLRALAVVLVMAYHLNLHTPSGLVGVDVFFVISGFLITSLLLNERDRMGAVSLRNFWMRRALRLFPALACAIVLALVLSLLSPPSLRQQTLAGLPWVLSYVGNWAGVFGVHLGLLGHTWSLAVEEQFYLLWPLVCITWIGRKHLRTIASAVVGMLAALDCLYLVVAMSHFSDQQAYYRTDTHCMGLLAGSALALWAGRAERAPVMTYSNARCLRIAAVAALVALFAVVEMYPHSENQFASTMIASSLAAVVLVARLALSPGGVLTTIFSAAPLVWLGRRSYAIYLYSCPLALLFVNTDHFHGFKLLFAELGCIATTIVLAALSYRWVEAPFLRRKDRLTTRSASDEGLGTKKIPEGAPAPVRLADERVQDTWSGA
jgi:peptidoglycan/LPS O-acetylase OafA/YrhL